ncbi:MAG: GNAT family N-acetyltransferase [Chloroflexota bacterium]
MALTEITTWFLEMTSPDLLRPARQPEQMPLLMRAEHPCAELSRFLYRSVGGNWYWIDRLVWRYDEWQRWAEQVETWVAYLNGTPAGYFELEPYRDGTVNIALFGLLPWAIGGGLGGWMLTRAVERAWALEPRLVIVNTCSLDGPHALANYQARGFTIVRTYTGTRMLPDQSPGPWTPGE